MFTRYRFKVESADYRPVQFPPPGPYWNTGFSGDGEPVLVAFLPGGEALANWWPDAFDIEQEAAEVIFFTDRMPCPDWYTPPATGAIRPKTLDGIKRLAKRIGRERGIKHSKALEVASVCAGFKTFFDARQALKASAAQGDRA